MASEDASAAKPSPVNDRALPPVLLALTLTTGLIDAACYLGLGHVFTANMTGNIVLLGFGLAGAGGLPVLAPLVSLGFFLLGAGAGGQLVRGLSREYERLIQIGVAVEVSLLLLAAILAAATHVKIGSHTAYLVIALVALAMGLRNAVVRKLAVPDLTTTVLTLTLTGLASEAPLQAARKHSARRMLAVVAMLGGACIGGLLEKQSLPLPLLAAAVVAAVGFGAYVLARGRLSSGR
jgi:uncharacterized membrane protein YoaK (UPF0700 family)